MALKLISGPQVEPISLAEAKAHLRVDHTDDDVYISSLIAAARSYIDGDIGFLQRALIWQTWDLIIDAFPTAALPTGTWWAGSDAVADTTTAIRIPLPPLQSIVHVKYFDTTGTETTMLSDDYVVDTASEPGWLLPSTAGWPATQEAINAVEIRFQAGYGPAATDVPDNIRHAVKLFVGYYYENREQVITNQGAVGAMELPSAAYHLLSTSRMLFV